MFNVHNWLYRVTNISDSVGVQMPVWVSGQCTANGMLSDWAAAQQQLNSFLMHVYRPLLKYVIYFKTTQKCSNVNGSHSHEGGSRS